MDKKKRNKAMGARRLFNMFARMARWPARRLVRFYYPVIHVTGREQIPEEGPVLFVANHANSILDPIIIGIAARRPVQFLAKAPLFDIPVFGLILRALGMLPAYRAGDDASKVADNMQSISTAADLLVQGRALGIFPGGKSHDSLKADKVKSGASRIAVQAAKEGARNLVVIPVGINFERKEKFRSTVCVNLGRPISMDEWVERIETEERVVMRQVTNEIDTRLKEAVIHLEEEAWQPFLADLESLVPAAGAARKTPVAALAQRKRITDAMNHFLAKDRAPADAVARQIEKFHDRLARAGLNMQSDLFRIYGVKLFFRQMLDLLWLLIGFVPAMAGTLYSILPFVIVRTIGLFITRANRSTIALERIGFGVPVYGAWYTMLWYALALYFLPSVATAITIAMIAAGIFALSYWRRARDCGALWWSELRMLSQRRRLRQLRGEHAKLREELKELVAEYRATPPVEDNPALAKWQWFFLKRLLFRTAAIALLVAAAYYGVTYFRGANVSIFRGGGLQLRSLPAAQLSAYLTEDERQLSEILSGLTTLEKQAMELRSDLVSGKRDFYTQSDNDVVRRLLFTYLSYRNELLRIMWKYQHYDEASQEPLRLRAFLVELAAGASLYESSYKFVVDFAQTPEAIRKLNEGEPLWDIPPGMYDTVRANLAAPKDRKLMKHALREYDELQPAFAKHNLVRRAPYDAFHVVARRADKTMAALDREADQWLKIAPVEDAHKVGKGLLYRGQSMLSTWVGDTRVRQPRQGKPLIQPDQVAKMREQLQPGDIILERQNWYLSRAFMPGFWAHAALYVGTVNDLQKLGLDKDAHVQRHWQEFVARDPDGHERVILEAVPQGVRITTLEHCVGVADSAAVLRPLIAPDRLPQVIAQAFSHLGKPYDFEFDFFSTDKLVCTELVYRTCGMEIDFPLQEVLGRRTLPPTEIARLFATQRAGGDAKLKFITFLDGEEEKGKATFRSEDAFAQTVTRPSLTWLN